MVVARRMARHSLTEARSSMVDLRAAPVEGRDLASTLALATRRWANGNPAPIEIEVTGVPRRLPQDLEQNVLRIAQEAVTNAVKHADSTRISIQLQFHAESLELTVSDNGRGFDTSGVFSLADGQFGLMGMRERAERLNGEMHLTSVPGGGTLVRAMFPIDRVSGHPKGGQRFLNRLKTLLHPVRT
jgi:signal transduction histidine kinase